MARPLPPPDPIFFVKGDANVTAIQFCTEPDGENFLASGREDGIIDIWDLNTRRVRAKIEGHAKIVSWIKYSRRTLYSFGRLSGVHLHQCTGGSFKNVVQIPVTYENFSHCSLYVEDEILAHPSGASEIVLLKPKQSLQTIVKLTPNEKLKCGNLMELKLICWSGRSFCLACYEVGLVVLWDWSNNVQLSQLPVEATPMCMDFNEGTRKGVCAGSSNVINVFEITENLELRSAKRIEITNEGIACVAIRPDGKLFVCGSWDHSVRVFSCKSLKLLAVLKYHKTVPQCITFSDEPMEKRFGKNLIACSAKEKKIAFWDIYNEN